MEDQEQAEVAPGSNAVPRLEETFSPEATLNE